MAYPSSILLKTSAVSLNQPSDAPPGRVMVKSAFRFPVNRSLLSLPSGVYDLAVRDVLDTILVGSCEIVVVPSVRLKFPILLSCSSTDLLFRLF